jgi:hypothetical protein
MKAVINLRSLTIAAALLASGPCAPDARAACRVELDRPAPLLELYTSEGCSSCPPADRWLSALVAREDAPLVALGYHVDYWDELGWVDRFAAPGNAVRQRLRAQDSGRDIVYTPQVMLGDDVQVDWRDADAVARATSEAMQDSPPLRIALQAAPDATGWRVSLDARALDSAIDGPRRVELALYSDGLQSSVGAGENRRLQLTHDRVVRALAGPWTVAGDAPLQVETRLERPQEGGSAWGIVAIVHARASLSPRWGVPLPLVDCDEGVVPRVDATDEAAAFAGPRRLH